MADVLVSKIMKKDIKDLLNQTSNDAFSCGKELQIIKNIFTV